MEQLHCGIYRRLRDVPAYMFHGYKPMQPVMDRGKLAPAVRAYANINKITYEEAHARLSS